MKLYLLASVIGSLITSPLVSAKSSTSIILSALHHGATSTSVTSYGALCNGAHDDTTAFQNAFNALQGTGNVLTVPNGTCMINATANGHYGPYIDGAMTLSLSSGTILQAITNSADNYAVLLVDGPGVIVTGGTINGDRTTHTGTTGESGYGIYLSQATNTILQSITISNCWGDGIYISGPSSGTTINNIVINSNRRQGISLVDASNILIENSTIENGTGYSAGAGTGLDIEPNSGENVTTVTIRNNTFTGNTGGGFSSGVGNANIGLATVSGIIFDSNNVHNNGLNPPSGSCCGGGVLISNSDGHQITNNTITANTGEGIWLDGGATHTNVYHNTITNQTGPAGWGDGIYIDTSSNSTITNNTVTGNSGHGIDVVPADPTVIQSGNTVSGNGLTP